MFVVANAPVSNLENQLISSGFVRCAAPALFHVPLHEVHRAAPVRRCGMIGMMMMLYLFTTVPHPHGHWQLQEILGDADVIYYMNRNRLPVIGTAS